MLLTQQASWKSPTLEAISVVITSDDSDQQHFHLVYSFADLGEKTRVQLSFWGNIIHHQHGLLALLFVPSITIKRRFGQQWAGFEPLLDSRIVMLFVWGQIKAEEVSCWACVNIHIQSSHNHNQRKSGDYFWKPQNKFLLSRSVHETNLFQILNFVGCKSSVFANNWLNSMTQRRAVCESSLLCPKKQNRVCNRMVGRNTEHGRKRRKI